MTRPPHALAPAICPLCQQDPHIFCPRDVDGTCHHCGTALCAAHLLAHFTDHHCIALTLDHCRYHPTQT